MLQAFVMDLIVEMNTDSAELILYYFECESRLCATCHCLSRCSPLVKQILCAMKFWLIDYNCLYLC